MRKLIPAFLLLTVTIINSCTDKEVSIIGSWEATFSDTVNNPRQDLIFSMGQNNIHLSIDEPLEDMYDIPGERLFFRDDSLYFEKYWGLEKYHASYSSADSAFHGVRKNGNEDAFSFILRRIPSQNLTHKIPRVNEKGARVRRYHYKEPDEDINEFLSSNLSDVFRDV